METSATFTVESFEPTDLPPPSTTTGTAVGVARMVKRFRGGLDGTAETLFTSAFDQERGIGTYLAMESFTGTLDGRRGTVKPAPNAPTQRTPAQPHQVDVILHGTRPGELAGLTGTGRMRIDNDGTHRLDLDYELH